MSSRLFSAWTQEDLSALSKMAEERPPARAEDQMAVNASACVGVAAIAKGCTGCASSFRDRSIASSLSATSSHVRALR